MKGELSTVIASLLTRQPPCACGFFDYISNPFLNEL